MKYSCKIGSCNEYTTEIYFHRTDLLVVPVSLSTEMSPFYTAFPKGFCTPSRQYKIRTRRHKCVASLSYTTRIPCFSRATSEWKTIRLCGLKREKVFLHVYLISRGPLCNSAGRNLTSTPHLLYQQTQMNQIS